MSEILIHEFAVDPACLNGWESLRDFTSWFGIAKGRVIARFPKKWFWEIYERLSTGSVGDIRLEAALQRLKSAVLATGRPENVAATTWLEAAETEHSIRPFRAIIGSENPRCRDFVVLVEEIHEDHRHFSVSTELPLPRQGDVWVKALTPLLAACGGVRFVDPFFNPLLPRFQRPVEQFCIAICQLNRRNVELQYHLKVRREHHDAHRARAGEAWNYEDFKNDCERELGRLIPHGQSIEIFVWEMQQNGQDFHARYVLTNLGGVKIEQGLDDRPHAQTDTDVSLMGDSLNRRRIADFTQETSPFSLIRRFTVIGN